MRSTTSFRNETERKKYLLCDGRAVSATDYPKLYALGIHTTPNLVGYFPRGASSGLGSTGGADSRTVSVSGFGRATLSKSNIPAHTHGRGTMNITGGDIRAFGDIYNQDSGWQHSTTGAFTIRHRGVYLSQYSSVSHWREGIYSFDASRSWTGETDGGSGLSSSPTPLTVPFSASTTVSTIPAYRSVAFYIRAK